MHSSVTELERCGTSCGERGGGRAGTPCPWIQHPRGCASQALTRSQLGPGPALAPGAPSPRAQLPSPVCCRRAGAGPHHVDDVEGEDLDAAHDSGERADDSGEDGQAADAEEEVLGRSGESCGCWRSTAGCAAAPRRAPALPRLPHLERPSDAAAVWVGEHGQRRALLAAGGGRGLRARLAADTRVPLLGTRSTVRTLWMPRSPQEPPARPATSPALSGSAGPQGPAARGEPRSGARVPAAASPSRRPPATSPAARSGRTGRSRRGSA